jgi:hypothetical protein
MLNYDKIVHIFYIEMVDITLMPNYDRYDTYFHNAKFDLTLMSKYDKCHAFFTLTWLKTQSSLHMY